MKIIPYPEKKEKDLSEDFACNLEAIAREGARIMLTKMLEEEVKEFLERGPYERREEFRGYRNGYCKERSISTGLGALKVRQPRISNVPPEIAPNGFESQILTKYQRSSKGVQATLSRLYLEGLSTGDFELVFRSILGERAPLSPTSIQRLKEEWQLEYEEWKRMKLSREFYAYLWVDGVYMKAGLQREKTVLLCVIGVKEDGTKKLLAMGEGYRESKESWADVLRDLKSRGMNSPLLVIGDGALGIWAALNEIYPDSLHQRCWNHKIINILDKLPKAMHKEAKKRLREIYQADTVEQCKEWIRNYAQDLIVAGQNKAAGALTKDIEELTAYFNFPKEHWIHLRTTNPIESVFSGVRNRTKVVKRFRKRDNAKYMIFKLIQRLSINWQKLKYRHLLPLLKEGYKFYDGLIVQEEEIKIAA